MGMAWLIVHCEQYMQINDVFCPLTMHGFVESESTLLGSLWYCSVRQFVCDLD
jgi:hypothetical protein